MSEVLQSKNRSKKRILGTQKIGKSYITAEIDNTLTMGDVLRATFRNIYIYTTVCNDDGFSLKLRIYPHRDLGKTLTVLKLTEKLPQTLRNETPWANGNRLVAVTVTKNVASSHVPAVET